ncbi:MAG: histidinol-phosphate transaminase [Pseudomonadota bacterium]
MSSLKPRRGILDISAYVTAVSTAPKADKIFKLSANESAFGASPKAVAAFEEASRSLAAYPDGTVQALREKIGDVHGLNPAQIICGAGSDELLQLIAHAYSGLGTNTVQTVHGFSMYPIVSRAAGAEPRLAPEKDLRVDIDAILEHVDADTRIVFLASPGNPTGAYIPEKTLRRLREDLREDILLVLDAAYAEFVNAPDYSDGAALVDDYGNVVMTRTFSKIYGLAAVRLGWAYCPPDVIDALNRIRGPYNVNNAAQAAGIAALEDRDFIQTAQVYNGRERDWLAQQIGGLGLEFVPSEANFLLIRFPDTPGKTAAEIYDYLRERGVIVRRMDAYHLPEYLRVSIGEKEGLELFVALLREKLG